MFGTDADRRDAVRHSPRAQLGQVRHGTRLAQPGGETCAYRIARAIVTRAVMAGAVALRSARACAQADVDDVRIEGFAQHPGEALGNFETAGPSPYGGQRRQRDDVADATPQRPDIDIRTALDSAHSAECIQAELVRVLLLSPRG